jgi:hypothetical protein
MHRRLPRWPSRGLVALAILAVPAGGALERDPVAGIYHQLTEDEIERSIAHAPTGIEAVTKGIAR